MSMEFMIFFNDITESQKLALRPLIGRAIAVATGVLKYELISSDKWDFRYLIRSGAIYDVVGYQGYDYVNVSIESNNGVDSPVELAITLALVQHAIEEHLGDTGASILNWRYGEDMGGNSIDISETMELLDMSEYKAIQWWEEAFPVFQEGFDLWTY